MSALSDIYDRDFSAGADEQASLPRAGKRCDVDVAHLIEEIGSMRCSERRVLLNRLVILMLRLLNRRYRPGLRGDSRRLCIREQRLRRLAYASATACFPSRRTPSARLQPRTAPAT
jgi:hypothetical protein